MLLRDKEKKFIKIVSSNGTSVAAVHYSDLIFPFSVQSFYKKINCPRVAAECFEGILVIFTLLTIISFVNIDAFMAFPAAVLNQQ